MFVCDRRGIDEIFAGSLHLFCIIISIILLLLMVFGSWLHMCECAVRVWAACHMATVCSVAVAGAAAAVVAEPPILSVTDRAYQQTQINAAYLGSDGF